MFEPLVKINVEGSNKYSAIEELSYELLLKNKIIDINQFKKDVFKRENIESTYMSDGIAIPHTLSDSVIEPSIVIGVSKEGILFDSHLCKIIILVAMPKTFSCEHMRVLSSINSMLLDPDNVSSILKAENSQDVLNVVKKYTEIENLDDDLLEKNTKQKLIIVCTGCISGVAHTYLAKKSFMHEAEKLDVKLVVETNGALSVENSPTEKQIQEAECIIVASDRMVEMDRFIGKRVIMASTKDGVRNARKLLMDALKGEGIVYSEKEFLKHNFSRVIYSSVMNGLSYMIPFVTAGGIMMSFEMMLENKTIIESSFILQMINLLGILGEASLGLIYPILSGYIAYGIGGRSALVAGMVGGYLASSPSIYDSNFQPGFFGALLTGILSGLLVLYLSRIKVSDTIKPLMPMLFIPLVSSIIVGLFFMLFIGYPIAYLGTFFLQSLSQIDGASLIIFGIVIGCMQGFDMGGFFGKLVLMMSLAYMAEGEYWLMGAQAVAIPVAPLGVWLGSLLLKKKGLYTNQNIGETYTALISGLFGISEGALPHALMNPFVVIPASMIGSSVSAVIALLFHIEVSVAWGGPVVVLMGLSSNIVLSLLAIALGCVVMALIMYLLEWYKIHRTNHI